MENTQSASWDQSIYELSSSSCTEAFLTAGASHRLSQRVKHVVEPYPAEWPQAGNRVPGMTDSIWGTGNGGTPGVPPAFFQGERLESAWNGNSFLLKQEDPHLSSEVNGLSGCA